MSEALTVEGFNNRGNDEHPFGFIVFNDETRVIYAPGSKSDGMDDHGVDLNAKQLFGVAKRPGERHRKLAHEYIVANGLPVA